MRIVEMSMNIFRLRCLQNMQKGDMMHCMLVLFLKENHNHDSQKSTMGICLAMCFWKNIEQDHPLFDHPIQILRRHAERLIVK